MGKWKMIYHEDEGYYYDPDHLIWDDDIDSADCSCDNNLSEDIRIYDIETDPTETTDLGSEREALRKVLLAKLKGYQSSETDWIGLGKQSSDSHAHGFWNMTGFISPWVNITVEINDEGKPVYTYT